MGFMATPINAPMAGEIWHLSIEDLFQPVQEAPRLGGAGPFVINLSVSTAPIGVPTKTFAGCGDAHVYQIQVTEDGRTRFRLRLGPFATEDEADAILAEVRDTYPGALTATATDSDLRVIGTMQAKVDARQTNAQKSAEKPAAQSAAPQAAPPPVAAPQAAAPPAAPAQKRAPSEAPAKSVEAEEISIDIAWPTPDLAIPRAVPPRSTLPEILAAPRASAVPTAQPPLDLTLQWSLPELDIPLPNLTTAAAKVAPTLTEVVIPAVKAAAPKSGTPAPVAVVAPLLTEAVAAKPRAPAAKLVMPVLSITPSSVSAPASATKEVPPTTPPLTLMPAYSIASPAAPAQTSAPTVSSAAKPTPAAVTPTLAVAPAPAIKPPPVAASTISTQAAKPPAASKPAHAAAPAKASAPAKAAAAPVKTAATPAPAMAKRTPPPANKTAPVPTQSMASPLKAFGQKLRQSTFNLSAAKLTSLQHVVVATVPAPAAREVKKLDKPLDSLESTQTMRALTPTELDDSEASRWFVIELALADHAFDPDAVPNLDIFDEYRLYSVAGADQGRVVHALRLGFFREEIGAVAVASYLGAYWDKPAIKRVSLAERERFADQRVEARKDVGATGRHAVIEITDELVARRRRSAKSSVSDKPPNHTSGH
jgi:SPOR domain